MHKYMYFVFYMYKYVYFLDYLINYEQDYV
jgi:hypothetical protein